MLYITSLDELKDSQYLFLYFYANWSIFHKKMASLIEKIEDRYKNQFYAIDVDYFKEYCQGYNIEQLPTILIFKNGKQYKKIEGLPLIKGFNKIFLDIYKSGDSK